ncbi:PaaX family transcriptional regulator [Pseudonocardia endophytica]|uniref:PaaX family transcriptional regulator n=1 Tax=Pseudonocardia endophytica TaxID=401976 RepID=A0A4R1HR03_PSEEN|nr:PaaX family transcriptional regulator C-terminal domain-containing protein [Pseudonocardia endophytica]TCK25007.1 PaaX family transcriptional regulator [Pseudonocardia endophytica]
MSAAREPVRDAEAPSRRRRELGQTSARSLLLTVLGEFVLPGGYPVWTQVLLDVLGELGVEPKSARQALARTAAEGLLVSDRSGRRVRWALTDQGRRLLSDGAARIYGFGAPSRPWDGRWLVLLASVPESRRQLRHRLRTRLAWVGLGSPAPGVWVSPDPGKEGEVAAVLDELGLAAQASSFVGAFGAVGRPADVVTQAWDLERVEQAYEEFLAEFAPDIANSGRAGVPPNVLARQVQLVHAWRRFPFLDPELPAELLPERWAGARAATMFATLHTRWDEPARRRWDGLLTDAA